MGKQTWALMKKTVPVSTWVIVPAAAFGLFHGSFYLDESLDVATAIGVVGFLSVCLGPWLAVPFHRLLMRGYAAWLAAILRRIEAIIPRTHISFDLCEQAPDRPARSTIAAHLVGHGFFVTAFFLGGFFTSLLMTILTAQIGGQNYSYYLIATAGVLIVFVVMVAVQCLYFMWIQHIVGEIETQLQNSDTISAHSMPVVARAKVIEKGIARTEQLGTKLVSIRPLSTEHATN